MTAPVRKRRSPRPRTARNAFGDAPTSLAQLPVQRTVPKPEPVEPEPWPPPAPVIDGRRCVELTALPKVGTLIVKMRDSGPQVGTVSAYEHFHPTQYLFPVRWGVQTSMEAVCPRTWTLPEALQPESRTPPRRTGKCAQMDLEAAQARAAAADALRASE